jgi:hypothetical protein
MLRFKNSQVVFYRISCSLLLLLTTLICGAIKIEAQTKSTVDWRHEFPFQSPSARFDFAMSTCQNGNVLLFGGQSVETGAYLNDTWLWDGFNWHDLSSQSNRPPARAFATMAFDPVHNQVVMFGGIYLQNILNDTWVFDGNFWFRETVSPSPPGRFAASMAYDERLQRIVLFGGRGTSDPYLTDTWTWNIFSWTDFQTATRPESVSGNLAYYTPGGYDVLFGGSDSNGFLTDTFYLGRVFSFSPATNWRNGREIDPNLGSPPSRGNASMAFYPVASKIILFGGSFFDLNTYSYKGMWNVEQPFNHPPGLTGARMAYHPNTGRLVLFGGMGTDFQGSNQTWTWGKQVACLPADGSTVRVGTTVRCFFKEDADVHFGYWTTDGFAPNSTSTLNKTFHTNGPGPASITAVWFDSAGMQSETFNFTIEHPHE